MKTATLTSWGRFPFYPQTPHPVYWRKSLLSTLQELAKQYDHTLAFGKGLSYGDSCLASSDHVIYTRPLNRIIFANWDDGIMKAEAGITLEEVLNLSIPRGWFLPVTPGTRYITLGGAVANDVHGKNHHLKGTFGNHIQSFKLIRSDSPPLICSRDQNQNLFSASIGGLGLPGIMEWIELSLSPIRSSRIVTTHVRFGDLDEFMALSKELDSSHEYSVAWVDCLAKGRNLGRGVFMVGNHALDGVLETDSSNKLSVPLTTPYSVINKLTLNLFNPIYYRACRPGRRTFVTPYAPFFYPLDRILNWNRLYGPMGFQQFQCVIPDHSARDALLDMLRTIATSGEGSFLAVLKRFGDMPSPGTLSFPIAGVTLALDFPRSGGNNERLFSRLTTIVRTASGRIYPAKDSAMDPADFRAFYPAWENLESLRDPALCSRFWQRVTAR